MADGDLDLRRRDALFDNLESRVFDVAVIGGGITGAGVARDAAMRGLSVALIEARDFASGTSSRSSKMIHGGLRYLAQGDLALVHEAASERKIVEAIAPHLARETPFVIPARSAASIARLRAGLWTFEKLGGVPKSRRHEVWSRKELAEREPAVDASDLAGAVVYPEYLTDDSRLTLANVRGAAAHGAVVANYAAAEAILAGEGSAKALTVADTLEGGSGRRARVKARVIVNAAGPWVDEVRGMESAGAAPKLELTRGVHLVFRHDRLPITRAIIMTAADRRGVFAVPKGAASYIGTTDIFHPHPEPWPPLTVDDVAYLLATARARLPSCALTQADIVSSWSGVRPLVGEEGKSPSEISRRDELWTGPEGVISIAGGKLTAYRRMGERVTDRIEEALDRKPRASRTAKTPLVGGDVAPQAAIAELEAGGMARLAAERLVGLYGSEAAQIARAGGGAAVEAAHAVLAEGALRLEDYWVRRAARAWFDIDEPYAAIEAAADAMAPLLDWSPARKAAEIEACRAIRASSLEPLAAPMSRAAAS
jgi:glycerol-3-phosphate dehydrogenase